MIPAMSQSEYNVIGHTQDASLASPVSDSDTNRSPEVPSVIPPKHSARTLVLCFDGTGDQYEISLVSIMHILTVL